MVFPRSVINLNLPLRGSRASLWPRKSDQPTIGQRVGIARVGEVVSRSGGLSGRVREGKAAWEQRKWLKENISRRLLPSWWTRSQASYDFLETSASFPIAGLWLRRTLRPNDEPHNCSVDKWAHRRMIQRVRSCAAPPPSRRKQKKSVVNRRRTESDRSCVKFPWNVFEGRQTSRGPPLCVPTDAPPAIWSNDRSIATKVNGYAERYYDTHYLSSDQRLHDAHAKIYSSISANIVARLHEPRVLEPKEV